MDIYAVLNKMYNFVANGLQTDEMLARKAAKQKLQKLEERIIPQTEVSDIPTEKCVVENTASESVLPLSSPQDYATLVRNMFPELDQDPHKFTVAFKKAYSDAIHDEKMKIKGSSDGVALSESDLENRAYDAVLSRETKARGEKWLRQNLKLYPATAADYVPDGIFIYEKHIKQ